MTLEGKLLDGIKTLAIRKKPSTSDLLNSAISDLLKKQEEGNGEQK